MKKKIPFKIILCFSFWILISSTVSSQVTKDIPNYFPVSPNAASFAKQGLFPVDYSTGKINIGVPIYTIKTKELTVPISLSYNSSGIQLNETASWIGLGWNLDAGGAIVRNTKGRPDSVLSMQNYWTPIPALSGSFPFTKENYRSLYFMQNGEQDTAPDEYVVSAPGLSGSFYFDQNDSYKAYFRDFQNTKVKIISDSELEITKDDGTIYKFGKNLKGVESIEVTSNPTELIQSLGKDFISAWHLTEIISANGKEIISFQYKSIDSYDYPVAATESLQAASLSSSIKTNYPTSVQIKKNFLQSITFTNGRIDFISTLDREDLIVDYKLNSIEIYSILNNKSLLIKKSNFNYDYYSRYGGNTTTSYLNGADYDVIRNVNSRYKSLRLKEIIDSKTNTKYTFDYNNTQLPLRGTTKQDYWGYINSNSGSLMPPTKMDLNVQIGSQRIINFGTGDRKADETLMQSGILKKITYPEGGYSIFEYEANKYKQKEYIPTIVSKSASVVAYGYGGNCSVHTDDTTFTAKNYVLGSGKLIISFMPATDENGGNTNVTYDSEKFVRPSPFTLGGNYTYAREFGGALHTLSATEYRTGNFGAYRCPISSIMASWEENSGLKEVITTKLVGGLRIKSIENFDQIEATTSVSIKRFDYEQENILNREGLGSYKRYIILTSNPGLGESTPVCSTSALYNNNIGGGPNITYGKIIETEVSPITSIINGKTEYYYQNIALERVIGNSPTIFMHPLFRINYPYASPMLSYALQIDDYAYYKNDSWNYGSLTNTTSYKRDATSNVLKKIKNIENKYDVLKKLELPYNLVFNIFSEPYDARNQGFVPDPYNQGTIYDYYSAQFFYFTGKVSLGKKVMTTTTETDYDNNEKETNKKTTTYGYENPVHNQVTKTETINSKNDALRTQLSYPQDLLTTGQNAEMQKLVAQNKIDKPIKTETFVNNVQTSESITKFEESAATGNLLLPKEIHSTKGTVDTFPFNDANRKINFNLYDTDIVNGVTVGNGNVLQYSIENGTPVCIIWGYNKSQPIAKIENITYVNIPAGLITAAQNASNTGTENSLLDALDNLRIALPATMVTTYTYIPLVGVSTITDPKGYKMIYTYDTANRLQFVKDAQGKLLSENQYRYKNQ
ncbi:RHS repeat domain-containing protein [Flavobacterium hydatis]|uniref:YD repeat-containing protein n=1 Tax=Flavobacterium hydatis TaxID=991 RepID=A0A086A5M8_FLAHY|nr:hypothetical protein [Flavobacterium hydatis]KFF11992.1 hypothetical protein IW20_18690 [Flavobacterium hydatis]OXA94261.1 hypothetical protein B0A62_11430 [Flavobacterium hydatis]